jgi:hypothetical protein
VSAAQPVRQPTGKRSSDHRAEKQAGDDRTL